jgi:hypothetical protein
MTASYIFQVWYFILQYLDSLSERGMSLVECLSFLFQLSFSQLGKVSELSHPSQAWLLIWIRIQEGPSFRIQIRFRIQ